MLEELSSQISFGYRFSYDLEDVYVPLSMALLTRYDDKYFGKEKTMNESRLENVDSPWRKSF